VEIKPFKKIDGNGYSFKEIWKIYDEQFNILRDIVLSLGDKYQVDNVSGSDDKIITLDIPYNSNQVFVYFNGVLQWKDRDYRENSPTEIELLFDRKATDDLRIVTIKSNVIKEDLHQYLHDIDIVVRNAKEQYDSARSLESRLVELYSALQQTHSLYTNNSTTSLVNDLTRLKNEYEKVSEGVKALDIKLKDLISSSEYVLATLNLDSLKELVNSIKENLDELSREKSLDIVYPMYGSKQDGDDASVNDVGECTFVGIDKKHWFMIDTFSKSVGDGGYYSIKRAMSANKITKFEFLLITHWHEDHYGNAIRLIKEGLVEKIYVQAKKWEMEVTSKDVRNFIGALNLKGTNKAVFITTSTFSPEAKAEAKQNPLHKIILIDSDQLMQLAIRHNVGIQTKQIVEIKGIDENF